MTLNDGFLSSYPSLYSLPQRRLKLSLFWGVSFALLVHLMAGVWLIQSQFTPVFNLPAVHEAPPTQIELYRPPPPPDEPVRAAQTPVPLHKTTAPIPVTQEVIAVPASDTNGDVQHSPAPPALLASTQGPDLRIATQTQPQGPVYIQARWTRFPDGRALARYYSSAALDNEIDGVAKVECTLTDMRGRVSCTVLSESPAHKGFGAATVKMVEAEGRVDTSGGMAQPGSKLVTTVRWSLD